MATEQLKKSFKVIKLTMSDIAADALLTNSAGESSFDLSDIDWQRIVVETNVTTLSGTSVTFKVVTSNDSALTTSSVVAEKADGTTDFASASVTGTGRTLFSSGKYAADGSAASTVGKYIGILADVTSVTELDGDVVIFIEGK